MPTDPDAAPAPGLFGTLLDRSLDTLATLPVLRLLYTLALVCVTGVNAVFFLFGWALAAGHFWPLLGWIIVVGVPPLWVAELVTARVVVEYLAVQHKISVDLTVIRQVLTGEPDGAFRRGPGAAPAHDESGSGWSGR